MKMNRTIFLMMKFLLLLSGSGPEFAVNTLTTNSGLVNTKPETQVQVTPFPKRSKGILHQRPGQIHNRVLNFHERAHGFHKRSVLFDLKPAKDTRHIFNDFICGALLPVHEKAFPKK